MLFVESILSIMYNLFVAQTLKLKGHTVWEWSSLRSGSFLSLLDLLPFAIPPSILAIMVYFLALPF